MPLWQKIQLLEANQHALARAFDQNSSVFSNALHMLDAHCAVYRRICNMLNSGIKPVMAADGLIDFDYYLGQYFGTLGLIGLAEALKTTSTEESPLIVSPHEEQAIVFGGDVG